jgi:predicted dehydrogenase
LAGISAGFRSWQSGHGFDHGSAVFYWRVHVFGTKGSAEVLDDITLVLRTSGHNPERMIYSAINVLQAELDAFVDTIEGKRPFPVSEAQVLAMPSAFEAAQRSMSSGNAVECDDI